MPLAPGSLERRLLTQVERILSSRSCPYRPHASTAPPATRSRISKPIRISFSLRRKSLGRSIWTSRAVSRSTGSSRLSSDASVLGLCRVSFPLSFIGLPRMPVFRGKLGGVTRRTYSLELARGVVQRCHTTRSGVFLVLPHKPATQEGKAAALPSQFNTATTGVNASSPPLRSGKSREVMAIHGTCQPTAHLGNRNGICRNVRGNLPLPLRRGNLGGVDWVYELRMFEGLGERNR